MSWCLNIMIYFQSILLFVTVASSKNLVLVLEQLRGIMVHFIRHEIIFKKYFQKPVNTVQENNFNFLNLNQKLFIHVHM